MAVKSSRISRQNEKTWYVYALVRSDTDEIFYIGKGSVWDSGKDRIDTHEEEARRGNKLKRHEIIRALWAKGLQVQKYKLYETDNEAEAIEYERALIMLMNANGNLSNINYSGGLGRKPTVRAERVTDPYQQKPAEYLQNISRYTMQDLFNNLPISIAELSRRSLVNEVTIARIRDGESVVLRSTANRLLRVFSEVYGRSLTLDNVDFPVRG